MDNIFGINYQGYSLTGLFVALGIVAVVVTLVLYIFHLKNKLNNFENPKYGFLGKNIYPLIGFITLGSIILFAFYGSVAPTPSDTQADVTVDGQINATLKSQTVALVNVNFSFTPYVSGKPWGATGDNFDIYWDIEGKEKYTKYELSRSSVNPSNFTMSLPKDTYDVKITLVYNEKTYSFQDRITY
jgi:hypothetical protein